MMDFLVILDCDVIWRSIQISHSLLKFLCSTKLGISLQWGITSKSKSKKGSGRRTPSIRMVAVHATIVLDRSLREDVF